MNGYLLDTNVALLAARDPDRLSPGVRSALLSGDNCISVASYWEVVLKCIKGKLDVGDPAAWWQTTLDQLKATSLVIRPEHVIAVFGLPPVHQDPFDRILVAQAMVSHRTLLTTDALLRQYTTESISILV